MGLAYPTAYRANTGGLQWRESQAFRGFPPPANDNSPIVRVPPQAANDNFRLPPAAANDNVPAGKPSFRVPAGRVATAIRGLQFINTAWQIYETERLRNLYNGLGANARPIWTGPEWAKTLICGTGADGFIYSQVVSFPNCAFGYTSPSNQPLEAPYDEPWSDTYIGTIQSMTFLFVNSLNQCIYGADGVKRVWAGEASRMTRGFKNFVPNPNRPSAFPPVVPWTAAPYRLNSPTYQAGNSVAPLARPSPRNAASPVMRPPRRPSPPDKEKKSAAQSSVARLAAVAFAATEAKDLIDALYAALPKNIQKAENAKGGRYGLTPQAKAFAIGQHIRDLDLAEAVKNVLINFVVDAALGRVNARAQEQLRSMGVTVTGGFTERLSR